MPTSESLTVHVTEYVAVLPRYLQINERIGRFIYCTGTGVYIVLLQVYIYHVLYTVLCTCICIRVYCTGTDLYIVLGISY